MPAFLQAFRHDDRKPSGVQGLSSLFTKINGLRLGVESSAAFSGRPTVARDKLWISGLAVKTRPALPGVPISDAGAVLERFVDGVYAAESNAHVCGSTPRRR